MSTFPPNPDLTTEEFELKMGPQHPSTHGVLQLSLTLDGERVVACQPNVGFLHRSIEKIMENRTYAQCVPLTDRVDYCSAMTSSLAYVMAVEKLLDLTVPPRAEYLRVIMSELNRIASHLLAYGTFTLDLGGTTPFLFGFRDREKVLDLFEETCGARLLYNYMRIGGMPALALDPFNEDYCRMTLEGIYSTVVLKDIMRRATMQSQSTLERIAKFLCQNIGSLISPNKIANVLQSEGEIDSRQGIARKTVLRYLELLDSSFIFSNVERYNIRGKELLRTLEKYYIVDLGFRSLLLGYRDTDRGHLLENIVYLALRRRGYRVYVGKNGEYEVDFVAETPHERIYIQVTETLLSEETRERELRPLRSIKDHHPKIVLSLDRDFNDSYEGIRSVNVMDWLLV